EEVRQLHHPSGGDFVTSVEFDKSGNHLVTSTWNSGTSWLWNTDDWELRWNVGEVYGNGASHFAQFAGDDSRILAFGQMPLKARVIDRDSGRVLAHLKDRQVMSMVPAKGSRPLLASTTSGNPSLLAIDPSTYSTRYRVLLFEEGTSLTLTPSLYYAGTPERADGVLLQRGQESVPLSRYEAILLDPKRVEAQAKGFRVRMSVLPALPIRPASADYLSLFSEGHEALDAGRLDEAEVLLQAALQAEPESPPCWYALGCVSALSGETSQALRRLETAAQHGYLDAAVALWDEDLCSLRGEEEFEACLARMRVSPEGRETEFEVRQHRSARAVKRVTAGTTPEEIFVLSEEGSLHVVNMRTTEVRPHPFPFAGNFSHPPKWSPDGRRALILHSQGFLLCTVSNAGDWASTAFLARAGSERQWEYAQSSFSPSGEHFALFGYRFEEVSVYRSLDGALVEHIDLGVCQANCLVWTEDSKTWLAGLDDARVISHRVGQPGFRTHLTETARESADHGGKYWYCNFIALNHANDRLVVSSEDGTLGVYSYPEFESVAELWPQDDWANWDSMIFDRADERLLVSRGVSGSPYMFDTKSWKLLWDRYDVQGSPARHFAEWSADEDRVFTYGISPGKAFVRDAETGDAVAPLEHLGVIEFLETPLGLPNAAVAWSTRGGGGSHALCLDERDHTLKLRVLFFEGGEHLVVADPPFYSGDIHRAWLAILHDGETTTTLEELAPWLLDPKRVRAAAAGLALRRPRLRE
ncbi:MAG: tetratricopeptide repeat protein, partial [Planctomycetota bacterium]